MGSLDAAAPTVVDRYRVEGMTCGTCVARVKTALLGVPGVSRASVDILSKTAEVKLDPALATPQHLSEAVAKTGYVLLRLTAETETVTERPSIGPWPFAVGALGTIGLLGLYLAVAGIAQGWEHALSLLAEDALFVSAIAVGFGVQVGLFVRLRQLHTRASAKSVAASGGTSTAAMLACCAHHLVDIAPIVGLAGVATLLGAYKVPLLWLGVVANVAGIAFVVHQVRRCQAAVQAVDGARRVTGPEVTVSAPEFSSKDMA